MKLEDIKEGETYNVRVKVIGITNDGVDALYVDADGGGITGLRIGKQRISILRLSTPETAPQYDPCRKFRKGDMVRVVEWNGRDIARVGEIGHVVSDEYNSRVEIAIDGWTKEVYYPACHLKLVTPAEELEQYSVLETDTFKGFDIMRDGLCVMTFPFGEKENGWYYNRLTAKAAAEAECKRLNKECRKELSNA